MLSVCLLPDSFFPDQKKTQLLLICYTLRQNYSGAPFAFQYWWGSVYQLGKEEKEKRGKGGKEKRGKEEKEKRRKEEKGEKEKRRK